MLRNSAVHHPLNWRCVPIRLLPPPTHTQAAASTADAGRVHANLGAALHAMGRHADAADALRQV
jgi:hypothetical protein